MAVRESLVIEIGSPRTRRRDETIKRRLYERSGVSEYWIVDPWRRTVEIYILSDDGRRYDELCHGGEGETVRSAVLVGMEVRVGALFPPR